MDKGKLSQQLITRQESYAERRQLFKDIWETSMNMDDKEDIMDKPKVIKTLRLNEMDRCVAKKKKKQKLKNLRLVCNKLLEFCDRQEADDLFYEQMATGVKSSPQSDQIEEPKIKKKLKVKKRNEKTKKLFAPTIDARRESDRKRPPPKKITSYTSPTKVTRTNISFPTTKIKTISPSPRLVKKTVIDSTETNETFVRKAL